MKKICTKCGEEKELYLFPKNTIKKDGYSFWCKECKKQYYLNNKEEILIKQKKYRDENKEKVKESSKKYRTNNFEKIKKEKKIYYQKNKEKIRERHRNYMRKRRKTDKMFKLKDNIRSLIKNSFLYSKNWGKTSKTQKILGCSFEELKRHLESQFQKGMTWDNYGRNGWHIDHIYPVSRARDEQHLLELNHYTNLQPLWAKDNLSKGNRLDWDE